AVLHAADAAYAGTDGDANPLGIGFVHFQASIANRLDRRAQPVMDERIHLAGILGGQIILDLEIPDRAAEAHRKGAGVEMLDRTDAAPAGQDVLPSRGNGTTNRGNDTQAGDYYATLGQGSPHNIAPPQMRRAGNGRPTLVPNRTGPGGRSAIIRPGAA